MTARFLTVLWLLALMALPLSDSFARSYHARSGGGAAATCAVAESYQMPVGVEVDNSFKLNVSSVKFPVTVDMVEAFALALPAGTDMKAEFGMVEVTREGKVFYNGQDITSRVEAVCQQKVYKR